MRLTTLLLLVLLTLSCGQSTSKQLTLAVVSGVEGEALKEAARDYQTQTGIRINVAEFPYANLF